ncbi:retinol dehydrogenase 11-like [Battus philenor]|uniref:retinol dehydrogenase 11-like n=1 Tax=Battus philenor TaxID=42288 RepID=UPI0035D09075
MDYLSGWCKSKRRLDDQTVIITGSNTGIGKETALDLYLRGARVILACRNLDKAKAVTQDIMNSNGDGDTGSLVIEQLDLCSLKSVRDFSTRILENEKQINILINNAGVMACPKGQTEDGFETQIGVNHFGHALLTLLLLPQLIRSAPARIVTVSSLANMFFNLNLDDINQEKSYNAFKAYSASKVANIIFMKALDMKLKEHGIKNVNTYSLHPGNISTELGRHMDKTLFNGATWVFNNVMYYFMKSPRCGAQTSIYCAVDETCAEESGFYYSDCGKSSMVNRQCKNPDIALKFWDLTIEKLHLQDYNPFV